MGVRLIAKTLFYWLLCKIKKMSNPCVRKAATMKSKRSNTRKKNPLNLEFTVDNP